MKLFAIHAPSASDAFPGPEGARAAPTGFSFAALAFGPLWLLAAGLWIALASYAVVAALTLTAANGGWLRAGAVALLFALGNLYIAVEGRALAIAARRRSGRPLVDVVYAHSALEAEKIYLDRELGLGETALRAMPPQGPTEVIGLFPEPGR
jgi:hypothetical protein